MTTTPKAVVVDDDDDDHASESVFTFSELFAGIGGFRLGLESISVSGKCVFANEIDPYAASIYRRNFDGGDDDDTSSTSYNLLEADILDLCAEKDMPADIDILTAGFPCQPFSSRGKQRGLDDERGQLYREIVRVLRASRPKSFIFENVSGLVSMGRGGGGRFQGNGREKARGDAGSVFQFMLHAFEDCGYSVTWNICNSKHFVAQQRERVFIVGVRNDLSFEHTFSWDWYDQMVQGGGSEVDTAISTVVRDIMEPPDSLDVIKCQLSSNQWTKLQGLHSDIDYARIDIDAKAPTLISSYRRSGKTSKFIFCERDGMNRNIPRFLTPRECCRIQGFPEDYDIPTIGEDGTARFYAGIGNAVVPQIVANIGRELVRCLRSQIS